MKTKLRKRLFVSLLSLVTLIFFSCDFFSDFFSDGETEKKQETTITAIKLSAQEVNLFPYLMR